MEAFNKKEMSCRLDIPFPIGGIKGINQNRNKVGQKLQKKKMDKVTKQQKNIDYVNFFRDLSLSELSGLSLSIPKGRTLCLHHYHPIYHCAGIIFFLLLHCFHHSVKFRGRVRSM